MFDKGTENKATDAAESVNGDGSHDSIIETPIGNFPTAAAFCIGKSTRQSSGLRIDGKAVTFESFGFLQSADSAFYRDVTFASKITIARMCLVPVFATLAFYYSYTVKTGEPMESLRWWALAVFVTAASTDGVDGWIARRFNQCSKFGAYIDPIADKALLVTGVITLSLVDWGEPGWRLPLWFTALVLIRDGIILGGIKVLYSKHRDVKIIPHWTGKICTVAQMFAIGWVMLKVTSISPIYPCLIAGIFTVWSSIAYIHQGQKILRNGRN